MTDYISRGAAIKEFSNNGSIFVCGEQQCKAIMSRLNVIPAADVVSREEYSRLTAENDALKKKVASLRKQISRLKSDASWDEDIRRGQVQGMW